MSEARAWLAAAAGPARADLDAVYSAIEQEVRSRGPACWASGRCCHFERTGHRLFVTGLEAAHTALAAAPGALTPLTIDEALARGGCPLQAGNLCTAHAIRPLGCRVYFCDRSASTWQRDLSERWLARVRTIHDAHAIPYLYGEWRAMLRLIADELARG